MLKLERHRIETQRGIFLIELLIAISLFALLVLSLLLLESRASQAFNENSLNWDKQRKLFDWTPDELNEGFCSISEGVYGQQQIRCTKPNSEEILSLLADPPP